MTGASEKSMLENFDFPEKWFAIPARAKKLSSFLPKTNSVWGSSAGTPDINAGPLMDFEYLACRAVRLWKKRETEDGLSFALYANQNFPNRHCVSTRTMVGFGRPAMPEYPTDPRYFVLGANPLNVTPIVPVAL